MNASLIAENGWCHLDASMRRNTVKFALITIPFASDRFPQPQTRFHRTVLVRAYKVVSLLFQCFSHFKSILYIKLDVIYPKNGRRKRRKRSEEIY